MHYHIFKTDFGWMGFSWSEQGLRRIAFPVASRKAAESAIAKDGARKATELPSWALRFIERLSHELAGRTVKGRFAHPPLDFAATPPFHEKVYRAALRIPRGKTVSYVELARTVGSPGAARAVGQAMARNPMPLLVPCHRVLASGGKLGGFTAPGGLESKTRLLEIESRPTKPTTIFDRGFDRDEAVAVLKQQDPKLGKLILKIGPFALEVRKDRSPYEWLLRSIIYQQLNGKAAGTIHERLRSQFGGHDPSPEQLLESPDDRLQSAGLSRQKLAALKDLARAARSGEVPSRKEVSKMVDEEIIERLLPIRGVGRWTVEMLLIFGLGRTDVLPVDDFAIRKGAMLLYGLKEMPDRKTLHALGKKWRPYQTVATWYLWRSLD